MSLTRYRVIATYEPSAALFNDRDIYWASQDEAVSLLDSILGSAGGAGETHRLSFVEVTAFHEDEQAF